MSASANRVAIVGAAHMLGGDLKDRLAAAGYPGAAVELLDLEEQVGVLTDYGDEARVVLDAAEASLHGFEVVCFCGNRQTTAQFAPGVAAHGTAIDCTGTLSADEPVELIGADGAPGAAGLLAVPHAATLLLASIGSGIDLAGASCTLLLPASDMADAGTNEMAEQAASMLNFGDTPSDVFGRRMAFDVWPDVTRPDGAAGRIARELAQLGVTAPALQALRGSVFHGLAASLYIPGLEVNESREAITALGILEASNDDGDPIDSPTRVAGRDGIHADEIRGAREGGTWLWLLLDNHRAITDRALRAIDVRLGRA